MENINEYTNNIPVVVKEFSETGRLFVSEEIKNVEIFDETSQTLKTNQEERNICISATNEVIGTRTENSKDGIRYEIIVDGIKSTFFYLDDAEITYFQFFDLADLLEDEVSKICRSSFDANEAISKVGVLEYPKESAKIFFKKYGDLYLLNTPQQIVEAFFNRVQGLDEDEFQQQLIVPVFQPNVVNDNEFFGENPLPYGIDSNGNRIQFTQEDISSDGWLHAENKDLVSFIAPFSFNMHLDISDNKIQVLELLGNFNGMLNCSRNKLTKLRLPYTFNNYLNCSHNQLTEISLTNNFNSELDCSYNNISVLDLTACNNFNRALNCNNNFIETLLLPEKFNNYLDVSHNKLENYHVPETYNSHLNLSDNHLHTLSFGGNFTSPLNVSNNILSDLLLPENYNMNDLIAFGNVGKISEDKFTFTSKNVPTHEEVLEILNREINYSGNNYFNYDLIESFDKNLPVECKNIPCVDEDCTSVDSVCIGDYVTSHPVEVEYYEYLNNQGVPFSVKLRGDLRDSKFTELKANSDEAIKFAQDNADAIESARLENASKKEMLLFLLSCSFFDEAVRKFTENLVTQLNHARIAFVGDLNNDKIKLLELQIEANTNRAMTLFNLAKKLYSLDNGNVVRNFHYSVGDEVLYCGSNGQEEIWTKVERVYKKDFDMEDSYVVERKDGIPNEYVSYEELYPVM